MLQVFGLENGDLATWSQAFVSVAALAAAVKAALWTRDLLKTEIGKSEREREAHLEEAKRDRRSQASLITGWWDRDKGLCVRNASDAVAYRAVVSVTDDQVPTTILGAALGAIPPAQAEKTFSRGQLKWPDDAPELIEPEVELVFTDAQGVRWLRDRSGPLHEVQRTLTAWADPNRHAVLQHLASQYLKDRGVELDLPSNTRMEALYDQLFEPDQSLPDIFVTSHDRIAALADAGLISAMELGEADQRGFQDVAISAVTYKGRVYGMPYGVDTVGLFINRNMVPSDMLDMKTATIDDVISVGRKRGERGKVPIAVGIGEKNGMGEIYNLFPLLAALGGGEWGEFFPARDARAPWGSIDSQPWVEGFTKLKERVADGTLDKNLSREGARDLFLRGETPFLIATSTILNRIEQLRSGVGSIVGSEGTAEVPKPPPMFEFDVTYVPSKLAGRPAPSITLVQVLVAPSRGANGVLAGTFSKDLLSLQHHLASSGPATPAPVFRETLEKKSDSKVKDWSALCLSGNLMPHGQFVPALWDELNRAEISILRKNSEPYPCLRDLSNKLKRRISAAERSPE